MKGRKPKANAVRRGGALATTAATAVTATPVDGIEKPASVALSQSMSATWDALVGHGYGYQESDIPFITQLVFNVEVANQAWAHCLQDDGSLTLMVPKLNSDGEQVGEKPNPYVKQANEAASMALKLADQLGCTPLARARIGLTNAVAGVATLSIAQQIDAAIGGRK